jgi:hypothetical protein
LVYPLTNSRYLQTLSRKAIPANEVRAFLDSSSFANLAFNIFFNMFQMSLDRHERVLFHALDFKLLQCSSTIRCFSRGKHEARSQHEQRHFSILPSFCKMQGRYKVKSSTKVFSSQFDQLPMKALWLRENADRMGVEYIMHSSCCTYHHINFLY